MKNKRKRVLCLLLALLCVFQLLTVLCVTAFAEGETETSSNVLDDLHRDENFDEAAYPDNPDDLSLQVITIAESTTWELLVYVYQPAAVTQPLTATSINISQSHDAIQFKNYTLTLLSQEGVFQKYKVNDFAVEGASVRYYEITNIYRAPLNDSEQSTGYDDGNVINELSNPVGKGFQLIGHGENVSLVVEDIDFISVTDKYVGFMRYPENSFSWATADELDVHFVAFSTDRRIDNLLEADVYYVQQSFSRTGVAGTVTYGERETKYSYLDSTVNMKYEDGSWFSLDYEWKAIEKATDFLITEEGTQIFKQGIFDSYVESAVDDEAKGFISSKDWVLRFTYTAYSVDSEGVQVPYNNVYKTIVGEVSILRLKFETDGVTYNLGVVDNKQTGSGDPDNTYEQDTENNEEWFKKLAALILLVLFVVLFWPFVSGLIIAFFKLVWKGIKTLIGWIIGVLLWPFKLIGRLLSPQK